MRYLFEEGQINEKHLLLLHGTGGDEHSLVQIARFLAGPCTILALRGEVNEDGMNRFFKRNGMNQFDYESLEEETDRMYEVIQHISKERNIPLEDWILVGYSNGANIAAHLLLERKTPLKKGMFFHAMSLEKHTQNFLISDKNVWLSKGKYDPIVSKASFEELVQAFTSRKAKVTTFMHDKGHEVTMDELTDAKQWLEK